MEQKYTNQLGKIVIIFIIFSVNLRVVCDVLYETGITYDHLWCKQEKNAKDLAVLK